MRASGLALLLVFASACGGGGGSSPLLLTFDPCQPLAVAPAEGTTDAELASVVAGMQLWNQAANTRLVLASDALAPEVGLRFQPAAGAFHGLYDDRRAIVFVNQDLVGSTACDITVAHELGHSFGLLHVSPSLRASLMNPGNLEVPPTPDDVAALVALWGACPAP